MRRGRYAPKAHSSGAELDWTTSESQEPQPQAQASAPYPRIWVGYLLGFATLIDELITFSQHPEIGDQLLSIPPLHLFLANFICLVYWLVCVYEYHVILAQATGGKYPIKPLRAAWFHFIPIYSFYWAYKWPREFAKFVNSRLQTPLMRPERTGLALFMAFLVFLFLGKGFGMTLLFWAASHLSRCLRFALAPRPASPDGPLPFS